MEWLIVDEVTGKLRRKYSNDTMRKLKVLIDLKELKQDTEGYNEALDREIFLLSDKRLRTEKELEGDRANG